MKNILKKTMLLGLMSTSLFAGQTDLWFRVGGGVGFSDLNSSYEKHDESHLYFGGIRPSFILSEDFELSLGVDIQKYLIKTDLKNHSTHLRAEHDNENALLWISPKMILDEHWRIGPYVGRYIDENNLRLDANFQDVVGVEADYRMNHRWMTSLALEQNIDHGAKHRVAKLSIAYNFGEKAKEPVVVSAPAPVCEETSVVVHFGFDKSEVSESDQLALELFAEGKSGLTVRAHTDERGSEEYNEALAGRRAAAVGALLGDKVESVEVLGESELLGGEHKEDRRVEVIDTCE